MNQQELLHNLSPKQYEICMHDKGFALVLAGPGSGKTTVTVSRICQLAIKYRQPQRILCQTFTVAAANEMKNRYVKYMISLESYNKIEQTPYFSTIHSFCLNLINLYGKEKNRQYTVIDLTAQTEIIREIYIKLNGTQPEPWIVSSLVSAISKARIKTLSATQVRNFYKISEAYQATKSQRNMVDFDDMIYIALDILKNDNIFREKIRSQYDYILLDEAQDMTREQFEIIKQIAVGENIFIVADDDQSIYGFRGANPKELMDFVDSYSEVKKYYLEQNYRSQRNIIDLSNKIIRFNKKRYEKNLFTENKPMGKVDILHFKNNIIQAEYIAELCRKQTGTTVILYRNNASGLLIRAALCVAAIGFERLEGTYSTSQIPLIGEFVEKVRNIQQEAKFIIPTPERIFAGMIREGLEIEADEYCEITGQMKHYKNQILSFIQYISSKSSGYRSLIALLDKIDSIKEQKNDDMNPITLSTIHGSKGLEYDNVFIIDLIYDEFPGQNVVTKEQLEEDRRLFYVAITRAKKNLTLCYPEKCFTTPERPSIFIEESIRHEASY